MAITNIGGPYKLSKASEANLITCTPGIQIVVREAIKIFDFRVNEGYRTPERQLILYNQGRKTPGDIVTNIDGYKKKGMHNYKPSRAVDLVPYRVGVGDLWADRDSFIHLAGIMLAIAHMKGIKIRWGNDWNQDDNFADGWDLPHFEELL